MELEASKTEVCSFWKAVGCGNVAEVLIKAGKIDVINIVVSGEDLEGGIAWDLQAHWGRSALQVASGRGHLGLVMFLLERGAQVDFQDHYGKSALMLASRCGHSEVARLLLDNGALVDRQDVNGKSALMLASENGYREVAQLLLDKGALVDLQDKSGRSAVMLASENGYREVAQLFLDKGAQVDLGRAATVFASEYGHWEFWNLLRERGYQVDDTTLSSLMSALMRKYEGCLDAMLFLDYPYKFQFFLSVAHMEYLKDAERLLEMGAQTDIEKSKTLLWLACVGGNLQICLSIVERHPWSSDGPALLWSGALVLTCGHGHCEIVKLLLQKGFPQDLVRYGKYSDMSVIGACKGGYCEVVKLLLDRGAKVDPLDNKGRSALTTACYDGQYEVANGYLR